MSFNFDLLYPFGSLSNSNSNFMTIYWCACHSSEFSLNVPVAIYANVDIIDNWKIIAILEHNIQVATKISILCMIIGQT
jgi:hypothetical protein